MNRLRFMALLEGSSLLVLLLVAMPLKYGLAVPQVVQIVGPLHGLFFVVFNLLLLATWLKKDIRVTHYLLGLAASFIPTGTFIYKAKILNQYTRAY